MNSDNDPRPSMPDVQKRDSSKDEVTRQNELPDYEEDERNASLTPASSGWLTNPKNWNRLFVCILLLLLLVSILPIYRSLKNWRAEGLIENSGVAFAYGDNDRGTTLLNQAIALSPGSESVKNAVELFNARGSGAWLKKLIARMKAGQSSSEELLGIAELEAKKGKLEVVNEAISRLPKHLNSNQSLRLTFIRAMLKAQQEGGAEAAAFCLSGARLVKGEAALRLQAQAALYLLSDTNTDKKKEGIEMLLSLTNEQSKVSLAAARMVARISLSSDENNRGIISASKAAELAQLLPTLPGHQPVDMLLAADLLLQADPSSKQDVIKRLRLNFQNTSRPEMLDFARWLNSKGAHDEVIAFAGPDRPRDDTDWLLIVLDAESAKGNWNGISEMLDSPAGLGIPDAVKHLFLARIAMVTGDSATADEEWRSVSSTLHLEKPETLAYIAGYEEEIGAFDRASITYKEMIDRKETHLPGLIGLIRSLPHSTSVDTLIPLYKELLSAAPGFANAASDFAFLKLLANLDVNNASTTAEEFLIKKPNSLARISVAALGRLRKGDAKGALSLYTGNHIDWTSAPDSWKVVYSAVLKASGNTPAADHLAGSININGLRPEERALLNGSNNNNR